MINEVIELLEKYCDGKGNIDKVEISVLQLHRIIKALEQQTCEDAVSREAVLDIFADNADAVRPYSKTWEEVKALPPVNPAEKQELCDDTISRRAVKDKLLKLCNELEGVFANIRMENQDESVCGLCEYDCPAPYECPGFDKEDCFKLADEIRHKWQSTKDLPSVNPQYTEDEIQKMQDLEQAEIQKAYELGKTEGQNSEDVISRQAVLEAMYTLCDTGETLKENPWRDNPHIDAVVETIEQLSPVNPQLKIGRWEWVQYDSNPNIGNWHCSECRSVVIECADKKSKGDIPLYKYCPQCGCRIVESQKSEVIE